MPSKTPWHQLVLSVCAAASWLCACKKEDHTAPPEVNGPCKLRTEYLFSNSTTPTDSLAVVYEGEKITRLRFPRGGYYEFLYTGNKIVKQTFYDSSTALYVYAYTIFTYNADSTVQKLEYFRKSGTDYAKLNEHHFEYSAGKLTRISSYAVQNGVVNPNAQVCDYSYTGDNITQMVFTDYFFGQPTTTYTYTYDTKKNYYQKQSPQPWFTDLFMTSFFPTDLPRYLSANNLISYTDGSQTRTVSYKTDDRDNLIEVDQNSAPHVRYAYDCP